MERLGRYLLRGPVSLDRLSIDANGNAVYRLRKPDRHGRTELVMTPHQLLASLTAQIPAPHLCPRRGTSAVVARGRGDPPQAFLKDYSQRFKNQYGPFDAGTCALNQKEGWSTPVPTQTIHATVVASALHADASTYVAAPSQRASEELTPVASAKPVGGTSVHDALLANKRGKE